MKKTIKIIFAAFLTVLDRAVLLRYPSQDNPQVQKASVKFSALMTGIKGKVGGSVFQGSKTGFTLKNKPSGNFVKVIKWVFGQSSTQATWDYDYSTLLNLSPGQIAPDGSNTNTTGNFSAQSLVTLLSKNWQALESSDREAWNAAAPSFPFTNKWGEQYTGSGFQLFISINSKLLPLGQVMQTLPPSPSDGALPEHPWNTIYLADTASLTEFLQLQIPDGIADGAALVIKAFPPLSQGKLKVVFGGKGQITDTDADNHTIELLPLYENLFGTALVGSAINVQISIINLSNGHAIYSASFQQKIPTLVSTGKVKSFYSGSADLPENINPVKVLSWVDGNNSFNFGNVTVDNDSLFAAIQLQLLQLLPSVSVTILLGGSNPGMFNVTYYGVAVDETPGTIYTANSSGTLGIAPLICTFTPGSLGAKSCTLTISSTSLGAPVVITLSGTGV